MSILFSMPRMGTSSELWMYRMIIGLKPHIAAIAAHPPAEALWQGSIPTHLIPYSEPAKWRRILQRLHIPVKSRLALPSVDAMQTAVSDPEVTASFVHFVDFALRFEEVWERANKPLFIHCHGYDITWDFRLEASKSFFPPTYPTAVRRIAQRSTLIANSHHSAALLTAIGVPKERIIVKYIGVPVSALPPARVCSPENPPGDTESSSDNEEVNILYLGRLQDFKAPHTVIQAFEIACDRGLKGRLTLAGDGHLRARCEELRAQSKYMDRITLLGVVDAETGERLRAASDIFTAHNCVGEMTRQEEAYGVSIVEAMAAGLPVVTGRSGGVQETIAHGETGCLVEPGDVEGHAAALLTLATQPELRRSMGRAGWQRVKDNFSAEKERQELLTILGCSEANPNI